MNAKVKVIRCPIKFAAVRCTCVGVSYSCTNPVLTNIGKK